MGSKGKRQKGSFAHDYDNHVMWNTYINLTDADLERIAASGNVRLDEKNKLDLKDELESYAAMAEAEKIAPPIGGSGRSIDFFNQHISRLAEIYKIAGGTVSLGRLNPSRKNPKSIAKSDFLNFCLATNASLPNEIQRHFNGGASHGLCRAIRRALIIARSKGIQN
tara:strand:+ start:1859 stop:2356 length:498 start_codon:yes stop_codon:yes gene_type:complete